MSQTKRFTWTNPASAVAKTLDVGFDAARVTIYDLTNGGSKQWAKGMADASVMTIETGAITTTNGVTPVSQKTTIGAPVSGFTNANPGVISATKISDIGIVAGDTINVVDLADNLSATTLNGQYTVASVTASTITTATNTSAYSVYVSGGAVVRVKDSSGTPVAQNNYAYRGVTLGTSAVGANSASMLAIVESEEPVV